MIISCCLMLVLLVMLLTYEMVLTAWLFCCIWKSTTGFEIKVSWMSGSN